MTFAKLDFTQGKAEQRLKVARVFLFFFWMINDRDFFILFQWQLKKNITYFPDLLSIKVDYDNLIYNLFISKNFITSVSKLIGILRLI